MFFEISILKGNLSLSISSVPSAALPRVLPSASVPSAGSPSTPSSEAKEEPETVSDGNVVFLSCFFLLDRSTSVVWIHVASSGDKKQEDLFSSSTPLMPRLFVVFSFYLFVSLHSFSTRTISCVLKLMRQLQESGSRVTYLPVQKNGIVLQGEHAGRKGRRIE